MTRIKGDMELYAMMFSTPDSFTSQDVISPKESIRGTPGNMQTKQTLRFLLGKVLMQFPVHARPYISWINKL